MTKLQLWIAGVLAVVILVVAGYCAGMKHQATNDKLAANTVLTKANDATTKTDSAKTDTITLVRQKVRDHVTVQHDTIFVPGEPPIVSDTIAKLISADDSLIKSQKVFIADLQVGIKLRDQRIKILEGMKTPRFSRGIQAGVGYCATLHGNTPCAYVGYGAQMRFP